MIDRAAMRDRMRSKMRADADRRDAERAAAAGLTRAALRRHDWRMILGEQTAADERIAVRLARHDEQGHIDTRDLPRDVRRRVADRTRRRVREVRARFHVVRRVPRPIVRARAPRRQRVAHVATTATRDPGDADGDPPPRLALRPAAAARACGVPRTTLDDAVRRGEIAVCTIGGGPVRRRWVVTVDDLRAWLASRRTTLGAAGPRLVRRGRS